MAAPGDMNEHDGMVALCFEKNTFLDVVLLPEGSSTQQQPGHRRCRSDSGHCARPKELVALSGDVVAWPEFNINSQGITPASDQETCREPSAATLTNDASGIKCKSDRDAAEWASEALEWQSQQGERCFDSPVSLAGRDSHCTAVADWTSEASTADWQDHRKGRFQTSSMSSAERGSQSTAVVVRAGAASTVAWQSQQGGRCFNSPVSIAGLENHCTAVADWESEASTVDWQSHQTGRFQTSSMPSAERGSQGTAVVVRAVAASTVEWQSHNGRRYPNFSLPIAERGSQSSSVAWASLRQTHASSPEFGGIRFGMDQSDHSQNIYLGASLGINNQQHGNTVMSSDLVGNGFAGDNNHTVPLGSLGHAAGTCLPCAHAWRIGGCTKGDTCSRCHLCGEEAFRKYRQEHRRIVRALRRADRRGQTEVGDLAIATQTDITTGRSRLGR